MISRQTDFVGAEVVARLAATLGVPVAPALPALWHWLLFLDPAPASQLRRDGHRAEGGLVPIDPDLPIRMWAGSRTEFLTDIPIGTQLSRDSALINDRQRAGRSGTLRIITVRNSIFSKHGLAIEEEQDFVYRAPGPSAAAPPSPPAPSGASLRAVTPDEILLFRFSALTFNAHRIHYDRTYATEVESYPDLVVHGPLQAILLAGHLHSACPGAVIRKFDCRGMAPAFAGRQLRLEAWRQADDQAAWTLQTRDPSGVVCMRAQAMVHQTDIATETAA